MDSIIQFLGKRPREMDFSGLPAAVSGLCVSDTFDFLADVVGEESQRGKKMQAGALLDMIDTVAGRIAVKYSGGPVATVSIDRVDFMRAVLQMDLVRLEGRLIQTGNSSMVVEVKGYRQNVNTRSFTVVCVSYVTMVAITPLGIPRKGIPQISYKTEEENLLRMEAERRKDLYTQWVDLHQEVDKMPKLVASEIEDPLNREGKTEFLTIPQTEVFVKRQFFPKHVNLNTTIFGGEVLLWMDKVATHTARHFTKNHCMLTVSMNRVTFKKPLFPTDVVEMRARVVYVRTHVLEVEIDVIVQRINGDRIPSHSGYFIILNADESGAKVMLSTGLKLDDADQESLRQYMKAKRRFNFGLSTDKRPSPAHFSHNFTLIPNSNLNKAFHHVHGYGTKKEDSSKK